jgi:hypothetical protein
MNENPQIDFPLGWNALLNHNAKTLLICGENKTGNAYARTTLELLNKATKEELLAKAAELGYAVIDPPRPPRRIAPNA